MSGGGVAVNEWIIRALIAIIPAIISIAGWLMAIESRMQKIEYSEKNIPEEIGVISKRLDGIEGRATSGVVAKELLESYEQRMHRIEDRVNNMHEYMLQMQRPPFFGRRGDLQLPSIIK